MRIYAFVAAAIALLAGQALAAPAPLAIFHCNLEDNYSDVKSSKPWNKAPQIAGGYRCTSDLTDTCNLGSTLSFSQ